MPAVSTFRLYVLRAGYLLLFVGLALDQWPRLIHHSSSWDLWHGVGTSFLATLALLAAIGIRYPVKMIPLLLFELCWKLLWLVFIARPLWSSHQLTPDFRETMYECLFGVLVFALIVPWPYVLANFARLPGDRWR